VVAASATIFLNPNAPHSQNYDLYFSRGANKVHAALTINDGAIIPVVTSFGPSAFPNSRFNLTRTLIWTHYIGTVAPNTKVAFNTSAEYVYLSGERVTKFNQRFLETDSTFQHTTTGFGPVVHCAFDKKDQDRHVTPVPPPALDDGPFDEKGFGRFLEWLWSVFKGDPKG
jgi:hypothetical protein